MQDERNVRVGVIPGRVVAVICAVLLIVFGVVSFTAMRGKSATMDEPLHAVGAYVLSQHRDFRINPEDPPLWQRWAALAEPHDALKINLNDPLLTETLSDTYGRWPWLLGTLYNTPGNDADPFLLRLRGMMVLLGVALGGVIAWWSWKLSGGLAAILATLFFALDPNFLAHAAIVKNDVAMALVGIALACATWRAGIKLTAGNTLAVAVLAAVGMVTKFSGPLLLIILTATLAARVIVRGDWICFDRTLTSRRAKSLAATGVLLLTALTTYVMIWAVYDFRFAPEPGHKTFDFPALLRLDAEDEIRAKHPGMHEVPQDLLAAWKPSLLTRTLVTLSDHRLLPQTWLYGMTFAFGRAQFRESFLAGHYRPRGFPPIYFPMAYLFKTPLATQIAVIIAAIVLIRRRPRSLTWTTLALAIPFTLLFLADVTAHLNIGLRHALGLYPFAFIAAAWGLASLRKFQKPAIALLALALITETTRAYPHYIPFFNTLCGGSRGGIRLLGDSNLDWGQDLPLLAAWQNQHPDTPLYLCYFGSADPKYYGIRYTPLPFTTTLRDMEHEPHPFPTTPGVLAISATQLQAIYTGPTGRELYSRLLKTKRPIAILGGSIYLYDN